MDGKLIYILLLIGYFVFKFFSEDKKAKERKKKLEDAKNPSLPKNETYEPAPKKEKPWDEILREIMDQSKQKRREVETVGPPPVRYPKFEPLKKVTQKKSSSKPQRKNIATSVQTSMADEIKPAVTEGGDDKQHTAFDIDAYKISDETGGRTIDLREAVIQSVILNRPEY